MKILYIYLVFTGFIFSCTKHINKTREDYNEHYIVGDTYKLHFVTKGNPNKPPLLLIHGAPGNLHIFKDFINDEKLVKHFQIIAVDRPGFGESILGNAEPITDISAQAKIISLALNANTSNKKATIVGRSYGGPVAGEIAALYGNKIRKIVMVSPVIDPENEKIFWYAYLGEHWLINAFLPYEIRSATIEKFSHKKALNAIESDWQKIDTKVTVIMGGKDKIADKKNLDFAKKRIKKKNGNYVFLPNAGHNIVENHPELVKEEIFSN